MDDDICIGLRHFRQGNLDAALETFARALATKIPLPDDQVAPVLSEVARCLIDSFTADNQSPSAYAFLRQICEAAAEVIAGLLLIANFPTGDEDPAELELPYILGCAGTLSAAGRHDDAIGLLERISVRRSDDLAVNHALFVAWQKKLGRTDDLSGTFCQVPFERFDVLPGGNVHICCSALMRANVGNLSCQEGPDLWNGAMAQAIRASIHDGTYRYCDKLKCPKFHGGLTDVAALGTPGPASESREEDHALSAAEMALYATTKACVLPRGPKLVNLSFDRTCNLACPSCRQDFIVAKGAERDRLLALAEDRVLPMLEHTELVVITGSGDPFASKAFRQILRSLTPVRFPDLKLKIMTNAVLFTPEEWSGISHLHGRIHSIAVSIDAARADTYAVVRRGGDWQRLMDNLCFIGDLHRQGAFADFILSFVVQAWNWREMPDFVELGERFGSIVAFSPIENWGSYTPEEYARQAVQYGSHPEHAAFRRMLADASFDRPFVRLGTLAKFRA